MPVINSESDRKRIIAMIEAHDLPCIVTMKKGGTRSLAQNAYLWSCYATILEEGGEQLGGWTKQDLHTFFLGENFGWQTIAGFGRKRMKPRHRSSTLTKMEFVDYVAFVQQKAAEFGVYIPDPEEM